MADAEPPGVRSARLAAAFEDLVHHVWQCEARWRFDDRIDLAVRQPSRPHPPDRR
jgi:hypothetical protein